jgi:hypothetical protein
MCWPGAAGSTSAVPYLTWGGIDEQLVYIWLPNLGL